MSYCQRAPRSLLVACRTKDDAKTFMKVTESLDLRGDTALVTRDRVEDLTKLYDVLLFYNWQPPVRNPMTDREATKLDDLQYVAEGIVYLADPHGSKC